MEKIWNRVKRALSRKPSPPPPPPPSSSSDRSSVVMRVSRSKTLSSWRDLSTTTWSGSSSKRKTCAICLGNMRPGKGHALFTAECSHTFHFSCIVSNVKHGNRECPICRTTWKDMPFHAHTSSGTHGTPLNPLHNELRPRDLSHQPPPWSEPRHFSDDEPLFHVENSPKSTSQLLCSASQLVAIRASPEFPAVLATESSPAFSVLVGVTAPTLTEDTRQHARAPIDLVVVLDISGSMAGTKLTLLKCAVRFVIDNLSSADRLSIVVFSSSAQRIFPLLRMSDTGRESATFALDSLVSSGGTNIVAGLGKGVKVLEERRERNPVASILLLSDGKDSCSIAFESDKRSPHDQANLTSKWIKYLLSVLPPPVCPTNSAVAEEDHTLPIPVHTFGIGVDHDAACMHAISDVSGGTFSFIQDANIIQDAFARCIGGLLSVMAQQLRLTLNSLSAGGRISSISSGKYFNEISSNNEIGVINVGDLYADEEKDFLVQLYVPLLSIAERNSELDPTTSLLSVECSYKDIFSKETVQLENLKVDIRRPYTLSSVNEVVCLEVDRQRNRYLVVEGITQAQEMAEKGDIEGAQTILENRRLALLRSASAQAGDSLCKLLEAELKEIRERMGSQEIYQQTGRAYTLSGMSSHSWQRTTTRGDLSNTEFLDGYETTSMTTMLTRSQTNMSNAPRPKPVQHQNK